MTTEGRGAALAPDQISIFYTCDTRGHISPCNCSAGVAGGIARRKTFVSQKRIGDALLVDVGNVTAGNRPWELLELEYILRGYRDMGYDAVNIGKREAGLAASALKDLNARYRFLVSANVTDSDGDPIFPAFHVVTLKSGYRAAVIGVLDDTLLPDDIGVGVTIAPPEEAIAKTLTKAKESADCVVLLAFANEQVLKALAERFYEITVIVGGDVEQPSGDAISVNKSTLVYMTDKGKSVGQLNLRYIGGQYIADTNTITMLLDNVADDPAMTTLVAELHQKQIENNYPTTKDDEDGLSKIN